MPLSDKDIGHVFTHTKHLWHKISGKRIFITGGTGFFGKWLQESFAWANEKLKLNSEMLVLSRDPDSFKANYPEITPKPYIRFLKGDVRDFDFPEEDFDYIIHAATEASSHINRENPLLILDTIVEGTRRVLDFAIKCNAKRFLLISSGAVYGVLPAEISHIPEDFVGPPHTSLPKSAYSESKRFAELLSNVYHEQYGLEIVIARCFSFIGPYLNLDIYYAIGNFIRDGLNGKTINVLGDGTSYRSYLYAADLAIWLWTILLKGRPGRAYNVGSDQPVSIAELAKRTSKCFPHRPEVKIAQTLTPGIAPVRYIPSIKRARKELSLDCWVELDDAIKRTMQFYQEEN